jgi:hypothetical protein
MSSKNYHKVITCASYGGTGSSVVTDLFKEFDNCFSAGDYEFRFLQDYDGVSTLENALLNNYHRMNSDIAIRRFKNIVDYHSGNAVFKRYEKFFKGKFKEISYEYIDSLIDISWRGYWEHHAIETNSLNRFFAYKIYPRIKKVFRSKSEKGFVMQPPKKELYFSYPVDRFYEATKKYTRRLCAVVDPEHKYENLVFDQLVPPYNISRYLNYFDDLKVIVIDRDPRDLFVINETRWKESWIPSHDVDKFIKWYRLLREPQKHEQEDPKRILRLQFEDVVLNYEENLSRILTFLEVDSKNHIEKKKYFNPAVSVNNMALYKNYEDQKIIKQIQNELSEYCFTGEI